MSALIGVFGVRGSRQIRMSPPVLGSEVGRVTVDTTALPAETDDAQIIVSTFLHRACVTLANRTWRTNVGHRRLSVVFQLCRRHHRRPRSAAGKVYERPNSPLSDFRESGNRSDVTGDVRCCSVLAVSRRRWE